MLTLSRPFPGLRRVATLEGMCRHCRRIPLVGEVVHLYGDDLVCELCRPLHRTAPDRVTRVRSPEAAIAVRRLEGAA